MAKTGRAVAKLALKSKSNAMKFRLGSTRSMITRTQSSHHEKLTAFEQHKRLIHGWSHGSMVNEGGINPGPAETFHGDGLPDEVIPGSKNWVDAKAPKTNAERAAADKRKSLVSEQKEGWRPGRYGRTYGNASGCFYRPK